MAINKVVYGGNTLIDLTADTITAGDLASGVTAHDKSGAVITGTSTLDADTSDANAVAAEILATKTAYVNGNKVTGSMANVGSVDGKISDLSTPYTIAAGYHDGGGKVGIDAAEAAKIIAGNIKEGVEILGVTGTLAPADGVTAQAKTVTAGTTAQTVLPDSGYDYLSQVTVEAIPYSETDNAAGGKTAIIGGAGSSTP